MVAKNGEFKRRGPSLRTGRFKLDKTTLAIGDMNGKRVAVTIPAGDIVIVKVVTNPSAGDNMVDVLWEGRTVAMYAEDLKWRGIKIFESLEWP